MVYVCTLSKELQEQAKGELNEDERRRDEDIEYIRKWIQKQPHLKIRTDDAFILRMLRGCKFSLERTKEKVDMHYAFKTALPEWFKNRDPNNKTVRDILKLGVFLPLKETDADGRRIILFRQSSYNPDKHHMDDVLKAMYLVVDVFLETDEIYQITGVVLILDMKGLTTGHMLQFPPTVMKKCMLLWQEGYAVRNKCQHYINSSSLFETLYNAFKVFFKEKVRRRLKVYGSNYEVMYKEIPKRIMPKEYGGETQTIQEITDHWLNIIDSKRKWILEEENYFVDESKRPEKPKKAEDLFGLAGSFRKLEID
ncbi:UNVERIFIED_CONTAM: hypothetical protein RMT77_017993 [Armadillidium vulgare]